jgi:serine/threonine-protein kinase HipA
MLAQALSRFAVQIERLRDIMDAQGVDHDIIEFLAQSIDTQVRQLKALQPPEGHHAPSQPTYP